MAVSFLSTCKGRSSFIAELWGVSRRARHLPQLNLLLLVSYSIVHFPLYHLSWFQLDLYKRFFFWDKGLAMSSSVASKQYPPGSASLVLRLQTCANTPIFYYTSLFFPSNSWRTNKPCLLFLSWALSIESMSKIGLPAIYRRKSLFGNMVPEG